jgi:hypothetical protein
MRNIMILPLICLALAACSGTPDRLRLLKSNDDGPEEFAIAPGSPLEMPQSFAALPAPGGETRAIQNPRAEAIRALGGTPAAQTNIPQHKALVAYAGRRGLQADIRAALAAEDAEFRRKAVRFTRFRIFRSDLYSQAYSDMALDAGAELARARAAGVKTPLVPPPGYE